eukprot:s6479_g3.t2
MSRLAQLLTRFRLPLETTSAELRKAYYREAKLLHPDRNPSSSGAQAFAQLRADFKEAKAACFCSSRFGAKIAAISEVSSEAFAQLRADFEEAQKLLEEPQRGPPHPSDGPDFSFEDLLAEPDGSCMLDDTDNNADILIVIP